MHSFMRPASPESFCPRPGFGPTPQPRLRGPFIRSPPKPYQDSRMHHRFDKWPFFRQANRCSPWPPVEYCERVQRPEMSFEYGRVFSAPKHSNRSPDRARKYQQMPYEQEWLGHVYNRMEQYASHGSVRKAAVRVKEDKQHWQDMKVTCLQNGSAGKEERQVIDLSVPTSQSILQADC